MFFLLIFFFKSQFMVVEFVKAVIFRALMPSEEFLANVDDARSVYFMVGKAVGALRASASSSLQRLVMVLTSK